MSNRSREEQEGGGGVGVGAGEATGLGSTCEGTAVVCGQSARAFADREGSGGSAQVELDAEMALADGGGRMRDPRCGLFSVEGYDANGE